MLDLEFRDGAGEHAYYLAGARVPSVTGILKASGLIDFSKIPERYLEAARERGTVVHRAIHYFNEQDLDVDRFCAEFPDYAGYLRAWINFCEQRRFVAVINEHRIVSRRHQVAGTLDCLGLLDGLAVLLDFKTGRPQDVAADLQTAAYRSLALEWSHEDEALRQFFATHPVVKRYAVQLKKDATFHVEAFQSPRDFRDFTLLVEAQRIVISRKGSWIELAEVA